MSYSTISMIALLVLQVTAAPIGRFGSIGRTLSQSELAQISDLGNRVGKAPWVILGDPSMIAGVAFLTVYLQPDVVNERLYRGRMLRLTADTVATQARNGPWKVRDTLTYAYVVPAEGHVTEIRDERDMNWPFPVQSEIDDDTLIGIVTFVRSKPPIPGAKEDQALRHLSALRFQVSRYAGISSSSDSHLALP